MIRISKMTDYATVILAALAHAPGCRQTAPALADRTQLGAATVSKVLRQLNNAGFVRSTRGLRGGYELARPAASISAAEILDALEGPVAVTDCSVGQGQCEIEATCGVGRAWQRVNLAIRRSLYDVTLAQLAGLDSGGLRLASLDRELRPAAMPTAPSAPGR